MADSNDQPVDRTFLVLRTVSRARKPLSITEVASATSLPAPTVHRLVGQLLARGMLKRAIGSKKILPGPKLVELGADILRGAMAADEPHSILTGLARQISEHCQIGIVADGEVLYVDMARANHESGLQFEPGQRAPLHCTSIGKLFLASLSPAALKRWLGTARLAAFTPRTITDKAALERALQEVRKLAWAHSSEDFIMGVSGCAVPIRAWGRFVAGIGISAPAVRFNTKRMNEILPLVRDATTAIAEILGNTHEIG